MAIQTASNFMYKGKNFLDARQSFDTILAMTSFSITSLPEGFIAYNKETDKYYKFNSTNEVDTTLGKWREYNGGGGSSTDEKVKLDATATDAKYLNELIDNSTIEVDTTNNCLVVKKIDGQTATVAEINFLTGVTSNIQTQIDNLGKSMTMYGVFGTKADLLASTTPTPVDGNTAIVIADEDNSNKQMTYIYIASNSAWTQVAESSVTVRDFTTEPINLATETTGTLHKSKIDTAIARLADVLDKATYKGTGDGIVKQADKLTGLTATIAALNQAVTDSHTHSNKAVLDKIVSNGIGSGFLADNGKYISILHIGTTSPTYDSQIWIDNTDSSKPILKIFDGTNWVTISGSSSGSGTSITVDSTMSSTSTNPVQNKVIKAYVDSKSVDISADLDNAIQNKTDGIYVEKTKISTDDGNALSKKSNGLFVQDLSDKINQINFAQKTVNEGLDYCYCTLGDAISGQTYSINDTFPFTMSKSNNMTCNSSNHSIILKKGKTYRISSDIQCNLTSASIIISIYNLTKGMNLTSFHKTVNNTASESAGTAIYTPDLDDEEIIVKIISLTGTVKGTSKPTDFGYFIAEEIGRAITIDPLEYANSESGIEDTPVGHIIPYMGNNVPKHYLICDGTEYNIVDYPYLAQHFKDEFGSVNYFGGDGTTTFAVPDLRGEFLRGSGTATRNTGTGASVGVHQNPTTHMTIGYDSYYQTFYHAANGTKASSVNNAIYDAHGNEDKIYKSTDTVGRSVETTGTYSAAGNSVFTSRPTNTSVLYCIKCEPTYFMKNTYSADSVYSTDERVIGKWIDGKPLYSCTCSIQSDTSAGMKTYYYTQITNAEHVRVDFEGSFLYNKSTNETISLFNNWDSTTYGLGLTAFGEETQIRVSMYRPIWYDLPGYITFIYTKTTDSPSSSTITPESGSCSCVNYTDEEIQEAVATVLGGTE